MSPNASVSGPAAGHGDHREHGPHGDHREHSEHGPPGDVPTLIGLLADWLPHQRWFAGDHLDASRITVLERGTVSADPTGSSLELVIIDVAAEPHEQSTTEPTCYQLFLGWRIDPPEQVRHAIIGAVEDHVCYDAFHDHEASSMLLGLLADGDESGPIRAHVEPDQQVDVSLPGLVISAEQSNTSIVFGDQIILKMFRRLRPGINPDVEIHRALRAVDSAHIAAPVGELTGTVRGIDTTLGLATRYFANSADGWSMATASVRDLMAEGDLHADEVGGDFAAEAHRLGEAVAAVHADLVRSFGAADLESGDVIALLNGFTEQARRVANHAPELQEHLPGIERRYHEMMAEAGSLVIPAQRIHGDLHLGQVLRTLDGWMLIDFEGEPSRSLTERRDLQSPLADIAGMLRSFDYAAHQPFLLGSSDAQHSYRAAEWSTRNQSAFCTGYATVAGEDPRVNGPLLEVFQLAKAVYEVGYEHDHRSGWVRVPLQAIAQLVDPERLHEKEASNDD